jgi:hypothetical protein
MFFIPASFAAYHWLQSKKKSTNVTNRTNHTKKATDCTEENGLHGGESARQQIPKPKQETSTKQEIQNAHPRYCAI